MPMRVCELVAVPSLDLRVVVDGDLERVIRWVHTTELADPSRYLQGGEVILTTGVWRDAGTSSADFVAPLRRSDVAALGYGLPEPDAIVPPDLEETCAAARLPLFAVPYEVPFIAVSRAFVDRVYGQREEALRERVLRNDRLVEAAGHGAGLDGILDVLDPGLRAWMLGRGRRVIAGAAEAADALEVAAQAAGLQGPRPVAVNGWLAFPIVAVGRTEAHLVVAAGPDGLAEDDRAAVDQTLPFLGLELARLQALRENERTARGRAGRPDPRRPRPAAGDGGPPGDVRSRRRRAAGRDRVRVGGSRCRPRPARARPGRRRGAGGRRGQGARARGGRGLGRRRGRPRDTRRRPARASRGARRRRRAGGRRIGPAHRHRRGPPRLPVRAHAP